MQPNRYSHNPVPEEFTPLLDSRPIQELRCSEASRKQIRLPMRDAQSQRGEPELGGQAFYQAMTEPSSVRPATSATGSRRAQ
jgi:hypothetical protein